MRLLLRLAAIAAAALAFAATAAEVRLACAAGLRSALEGLPQKFEAVSGHHLVIVFDPPPPLAARIARGEAFDVVVVPEDAMAKLERAGHVEGGAHPAIARSQVGIGVRKGAPHPDISSPEALKKALLSPPAVVHSDPARGGVGGVGAVALFEQLGITGEMKARTVFPGAHSPDGIAGEVNEGRASLAINSLHELQQSGLEVVGPFPGALARNLVFVVAPTPSSPQPGAARSLIDYLSGPEVAAMLHAHGLARP